MLNAVKLHLFHTTTYMKNRNLVPSLSLLLLGFLTTPAISFSQSDNGPILKGQRRGDVIPGRFIVVLKAGAQAKAV